jgi:hypothetical protein
LQEAIRVAGEREAELMARASQGKEMEAKFEQYQAEIAQLQEAIRVAGEREAELMAGLSQGKEMEAKFEQSQAEIARLEQRLQEESASTKDFSHFENDYKDAQEMVATLKDKLQNYQTLEMEAEMLKNLLSSRHFDAFELAEVRQELQEKVNLIGDLQISISLLEQDLNGLACKNQDLEKASTEYKMLLEQNGGDNQELLTARQKVEELEKQVAMFESQQDESKEEILTLKLDLERSGNKISEDTQETLITMQEALNSEREKTVVLETLVMQGQNELLKNRDEMKQNSDLAALKNQELEVALQNLYQEKELYAINLEEQKQLNEKLQQENTQWESFGKTHEEKLVEWELKNKELEQKLNDFSQLASLDVQSKSQVAELQDSFNTLLSKYDEEKKRSKKLEEELNRVVGQMKSSVEQKLSDNR